MRVLILTQWYPPEPALLMQELAQTLLARGHDVTVLTGYPNYPSGKLYPGYRVRLHQREMVAGVPIVRVPLYPEHSSSAMRRILNYMSFAVSSALLGPWLIKRPDAIFVYHPPLTVGIPAFLLSRLWRVPFVYQIQDLWPESLRASGMLDNKRMLGWVSRFADLVYRWAAAICVISPGFRQNLLSKGVPAKKIHVISNWVDTSAYYPTQPNRALAACLKLAGHFNVMYAGNIGQGQGLETLVEAAELLKDLPNVQFVIVGDGIALSGLQQAVETRHLDNVRFVGRHAPQEMSAIYALADVLLIHLKDDPLYRITIPHKTFAYMASGKPILAAVAGDAADVITETSAGLTCPPDDPLALALKVREFVGMSADQRQTMATSGLKAIYSSYSKRALVGEIEKVLLLVTDLDR
jgi:colanic acid biosynthesis glycosyl transferase WcaI